MKSVSPENLWIFSFGSRSFLMHSTLFLKDSRSSFLRWKTKFRKDSKSRYIRESATHSKRPKMSSGYMDNRFIDFRNKEKHSSYMRFDDRDIILFRLQRWSDADRLNPFGNLTPLSKEDRSMGSVGLLFPDKGSKQKFFHVEHHSQSQSGQKTCLLFLWILYLCSLYRYGLVPEVFERFAYLHKHQESSLKTDSFEANLRISTLISHQFLP